MFWRPEKTKITNLVSRAARSFTMILAVCTCSVVGGMVANAQDIGTDAFVDTQALNLRAAPNAGSTIIRTLPRRTVVSILDSEGGWARVYVPGANGAPVEGWLSTRFLSQRADTFAGIRPPSYTPPLSGQQPLYPPYNRAGPLRVSKLDFDCRPPLFGNSGIRDCVASVRVQLSAQDYDPNRTDSVPIACRGVITYRTDVDRYPRRIVAVERWRIARNDTLGQSVRVDFDVRSNADTVISAELQDFSCALD